MRWLPLILILLLAIWIRLPLLQGTGYSTTDIGLFEDWTRVAIRQGLFGVYTNAKVAPVDHPPIGVVILTASAKAYELLGGSLDSDNPGFRTAIKFPSFIFDLLLIAAVYFIALRELAGRRWAVFWAIISASILAFTPGIIADSVWWGQTDGLFAFFMLTTVYALHRRAVSLAWVLYALTLLVKFQGITLLPLLVILTWRRQGIRQGTIALVKGVALFVLVFALGLAPFALASGDGALRPYRDSVGKYPFISINAHNFWFWALASQFSLRDFGQPTDLAYHVGPYPVRTVGFALFAVAAGLIALRALLLPQRRDEFLLACGLHTAFFMVSTQMHERYLYPAVPLMVGALIEGARRWRGVREQQTDPGDTALEPLLWLLGLLVILCLGFAVTVSQNILAAGSRDYVLWGLTWLVIGWTDFQNARLNVVLTVLLFGAIFYPVYRLVRLPALTPRRAKIGLALVVAILLLVEVGLRADYRQLPEWMQNAIAQVHVTPLTEWRINTTVLSQPDEVYGTALRPNLQDVPFAVDGNTFTVRTAALPVTGIGYRTTDSPGQTLAGDVLALGGANTFCMTSLADCWTSLLATQQSVQVANLGQPNTGSMARLALLRQVLQPQQTQPVMRPRLVIWQWSVQDLRADYALALAHGHTPDLTPPPDPAHLPASCHPTLGQYSAIYALICTLDRWPPYAPRALAQYGNVALTMPADLDPLGADRPEMRFGYDQTVQALSTAQDAVRATSTPAQPAALIIVLLPVPQEVYSSRESPPFSSSALAQLSQSRLRLAQACGDHGWTCVDLYAALRSQADHAQQVFYSTNSGESYLNAAGNKVVAQVVGQAVADALKAK